MECPLCGYITDTMDDMAAHLGSKDDWGRLGSHSLCRWVESRRTGYWVCVCGFETSRKPMGGANNWDEMDTAIVEHLLADLPHHRALVLFKEMTNG